MPRAYQRYSIALIAGGLIVAVFALPYLKVVPTAIIAGVVITSYAIVPVAPRIGGGIRHFITPTIYSIALLASPADAFVGAWIGTFLANLVALRRRPWRSALGGVLFGSQAAIPSLLVRGWLVQHAALTVAMLVAPIPVVALAYTSNVTLLAGLSHFRYGLSFWGELKTAITENIGDQALDAWFIFPIAVGAAALPPAWWPGLLLASIAMSRLNAGYMLAQTRRVGEGAATW